MPGGGLPRDAVSTTEGNSIGGYLREFLLGAIDAFAAAGLNQSSPDGFPMLFGEYKSPFPEPATNELQLARDLGPTLPVVVGGVSGKFFGPTGTTGLLAEARVARDALATELRSLKRPPATVTAGYNMRTGEVAARACGGGRCAEDYVLEALGGNKAEVRFTEAVRPRKPGTEVPVCLICEANYGREVFPPDTLFKSDF